MASTTSKYAIPKTDDFDNMSGWPLRQRQAMDRIDLLLGESGTDDITPSAANTTTTKRVNYSRSYGALAPLVPSPFVVVNSSIASTDIVNVWSSAPDATGFTLNIRASSTTTRQVRWMCRA